jgi:Tol biopolymer transport system component/DNA-binding winged helix-turn-helix (wHTH) protein
MYAFGAFELDPRSHELRRGGVRIKIQDQPFLILVKLLERPGQLVTRDELRSALWSGDTFVDFDTGLNSAVKRLREALGDSAEAPAFIETLPKLGYRFVANVEVRRSQLPGTAAEDTPPEARNSRHWRHWAAATALFLAAVAVMFVYFRSSGAPPTRALEVVPLTGLPDIENHAAFSSDGNHVAFVVSEPADRAGLYIMVIGGEKPLRLTADSNDCCPVWSPDGRAVAYARNERDGYTIYTVPALGGTPKVLYAKQSYFRQHIREPPSFSWSPDGTELAVSTISPTLGRPAITLISLEAGTSRPITSPLQDYSDWNPAFSPDGKSVAFVRSSGTGDDEDVYTVPVAGGQGKRLTFDSRQVESMLAWTPDSRDIVFASPRAGAWTLWRVPASGGNPQRVEGVGTSALFPAIALNGQRLAYTSVSARVRVQRINLSDSKHISGPPQLLFSSKTGMGLPSFSSDGSKLAFESTQSGYDEIWMAASDGSSPRQLTFLKGVSGTPHWSYDGRLVAFDYSPAEMSEIYITDVSGGLPRKFETNPGANNVTPSWSRDSHSIYFASSRGQGSFQVWKAHYPEGGTIQLTKYGGTFPLEGADGNLYYSKSTQSDEIWKIPSDGGPETLVVKAPYLDGFFNWNLAPGGVYFIASKPGEQRRLSFYDFSAGTITELLRFEKHTINPALSPDGKFLIVNQLDESDQTIMLVNHFH